MSNEPMLSRHDSETYKRNVIYSKTRIVFRRC